MGAPNLRGHGRGCAQSTRAIYEGKPLRKRRLRRTTEIEKILTRVRAGSTAIQLIRPDGESGDLDMDVEELIDACIEYSHVRSVELQVRDIA